MTAKRFILQDLDILCRVLDNGKPINGIETVHLLNKFYDENEQLKSELKALRKKYNDFSDAVDKRLKELRIE